MDDEPEAKRLAAPSGTRRTFLRQAGSAALMSLVPALPVNVGVTPSVDWRVVLFALGVATFAGVVAGLAPAPQGAGVRGEAIPRLPLLLGLSQQIPSVGVARIQRRCPLELPDGVVRGEQFAVERVGAPGDEHLAEVEASLADKARENAGGYHPLQYLFKASPEGE